MKIMIALMMIALTAAIHASGMLLGPHLCNETP